MPERVANPRRFVDTEEPRRREATDRRLGGWERDDS
jgi:hypothetical protein